MSTISLVIVSIEDGVKLGDQYAPARKVKVELHSDVAEGEDADSVLDMVGRKASAKVDELLGRTAKAEPKKAEPKKAAAAKVIDVPGKPGDEALFVEQAPAPTKAAPVKVVVDAPAEADPMAEFEVVPVENMDDATLMTFVTKKNGSKPGLAPAIRDVIAGFNPDPAKAFRATDIPQNQRKEFLARLDKL